MSEDELRLHEGYAMQLVGGSDGERKVLRLKAPDGRVCLTISLSAAGPVVELSAAALSVATEGDLTIDCERFQVNARRDMALVAGGSIAQDAGGNVTTRADGDIMTEAVAQQHRARLGNVDLIANDDVSLDGERVRLNCPNVLTSRRVELPKTVVSRGAITMDSGGDPEE